jgi:DNA ligase (NAD+)
MDTKELNKIAKKLNEADKAYYNTGHPVLTDQEYDSLRGLLHFHDSQHPYFEKIGDKPSSSWEKANHDIPMGSLEKIHTEEDFIKWAEKYPDEILIIQPKIDGLSLGQKFEIEENESKFVQAISRGDGIIGEDISLNVQKMIGFVENPFIMLSEEIWKNSNFSVRCEIILNKTDLDRINSISQEDPYKNCRNAASGISRRLDGKFCKYLSMLYYDILTENPLDEDEKIELLKTLGFNTVPYSTGNAKKMVELYKKFKEGRDLLPYGIDGMVIKINSWKKQQELGVVNGRPKGQIAWKFDPPGSAAYLRSVTWEIGRTGVITPLGHVDPVDIEGSVISKVTLHNIAEIKRLGVGIDDTIMLIKAGDIIPKIISVIEHKECPIEIPTECPCCGSLLLNNGTQLFCENDFCSAKELQRILHFIKTVKIDEFGEALANELYIKGKLKSIIDIYNLKPDDIACVESWGEKSAQTIIGNINKTQKMSPSLFLSSLGIPSLSTSTAEDLWNKYSDLNKIRTASIEDICTIKGYSTISATKIVDGLKKIGAQIDSLLKHIELQDTSTGGKLIGQSFCFTGEMTNTRSFYQALVTKHNGKNDSTVTKTTTYLVCNSNKGSSKSRKAEQYGVKIINEDDFMKIVGETIDSKPKLITKSLFEEEN